MKWTFSLSCEINWIFQSTAHHAFSLLKNIRIVWTTFCFRFDDSDFYGFEMNSLRNFYFIKIYTSSFVCYPKVFWLSFPNRLYNEIRRLLLKFASFTVIFSIQVYIDWYWNENETKTFPTLTKYQLEKVLL